MKKLIAVVLVLAVIWAVPGLRNRLGVVMLPVFERLGPIGDRIADPVRAFKARNEQGFYLRMLSDDETEGRTLPDERTFAEWVDRRMPQETGIDPWGRAYWLRRRGMIFTVGSDGPDRERDTPDDVMQADTL